MLKFFEKKKKKQRHFERPHLKKETPFEKDKPATDQHSYPGHMMPPSHPIAQSVQIHKWKSGQ